MTPHPPVETHLPLHPLEFEILLALSEGRAHAYAVVCTIEERQPSWSQILPTNLYRRIWRLADEGLIREVPGGPAGNRRRRYFEITALGRKVAVAEATRLRGLLTTARRAGVVPEPGGAK